MTQQMYGFNCNDVRRIAFEFRRGELPVEDHKRTELHLESCQACRDYVSRINGMLKATTQHDFAKDIDRNALFENIMARVNEDETGKEEPNEVANNPVVELAQFAARNETAEDGDVDENVGDYDDAANDNRSIRFIIGAVLVAAGILIGIALPRFLESEAPQETVVKKETIEKPIEIRENTLPKLFADISTFSLQPSPKSAQNISVFGDASAEWRVEGNVDQTMQLSAGTVLVEFVPTQKGASFEVETDAFTIEVIGTVFYASTEKGVVGVVTGKVRVTPTDGDPVTLERGQEFVVGTGVRNADARVLADAERHVDLPSHMKKIDAVKEPPKPKKRKYSSEVVETPRRKLRNAAEAALREGRFGIAAEYYERMVEEFPATDPENASLRLDLARIYIRHLKQPRRAVRHLKRFVGDRPTDVATPTALAEMCKISKQLGTTEPQCAE